MTSILEARHIKEAAALIGNNAPSGLVAWGPDRPLCKYCRLRLADSSDYCVTCKFLSEHPLPKVNTGILITGDIHELEPPAEKVEQISNKETLVLLRAFQVYHFLMNQPETNKFVAVIFPGSGDMMFADALAKARYYGSAIEPEASFLVRFFFNFAHMRTLTIQDYLSPEITYKLCSAATLIKSEFSQDEIGAVCNILQKDKTNRIYELSRFYAMCSPSQKNILSQLEIHEIDPHRGLLLFQMTRYVSKPD